MKQEDINKVIKNSFTNFIVEFFNMNKLHNDKYDDNVIAFGAIIPEFKYYFLVKDINDELEEHRSEMMHDILCEYGYQFNLQMNYYFLTNQSEFEILLKRKEFECIFVRPEYKDSFKDCNLKFWIDINEYFTKYVNGGHSILD